MALNTSPIWITPPGDLGLIPELEYYELPLDAYDPLGSPYPPLRFSVISGSLPPGLELYDDGRILGIPVLGQIRGVPFAVNKVTTSTFTVRCKNPQNQVADRTFTLTVAGLNPPQIIPVESHLGNYIDGTYVDIQIDAIEPNGLLTPVFSIISGELPPGLTLSSTGKITGFIRPVTSDQTVGQQGFDNSPFGYYGFDFIGVTVSKNYQFTVEANDTVNYDTQTYTIYVISRQDLTADNDTLTSDSTYVTVDTSTVYSPVIYTPAGLLGSIRQNTHFAYQISAEDYDTDAITFQVDSGSLPSGLTLDPTSGWIYGMIPYGSLGTITYNFSVKVYKSSAPEYTSDSVSYSIKVLGQISDTVEWITNSDLGYIYNGEISELKIEAQTVSGRILTYNLVTTGALPIGLKMDEDGTISGRVSFETFSLDGGTITFDGDLSTFDQTYTFTVAVYDANNYVYDEKEFSVTVIKQNSVPYENLYCQLLPSRDQRSIFYNIVNNSDIIPTNYLYRPWDPWFGKNTQRRVLLQAGLSPAQIETYVSAMTYNHYFKKLSFGNVKTARALDSNLNVLYEVVYLELLDDQTNSAGLGPAQDVIWPTNNAGVTTVHPNSFTNMASRITDNVGYSNRSILPKWMSSRQANNTILGFTRALVLCYTLPNKSLEIAYRINNLLSEFGFIEFTIDRYEYDSALSANFEKYNSIGTGTITTLTTSNVVTGSSTTFTSELYPGKNLFVNNVSVGTVSTVSNATSLILTANANIAVTGNSFSFDSNVFTINNFVVSSGNINANTSSPYIEGIVTNISGTGLISGTINSSTIYGTETSFNTELIVGKTLYESGNSIGIITSIRNATELTIDTPLSSAISNVSFTASGTTTVFVNDLHIGDTIVVNTNVRLGTVKTIHSNTNVELYSNSLSTVSNVSYSHTARDTYTTPGDNDKYLKFPQIGVLS